MEFFLSMVMVVIIFIIYSAIIVVPSIFIIKKASYLENNHSFSLNQIINKTFGGYAGISFVAIYGVIFLSTIFSDLASYLSKAININIYIYALLIKSIIWLTLIVGLIFLLIGCILNKRKLKIASLILIFVYIGLNLSDVTFNICNYLLLVSNSNPIYGSYYVSWVNIIFLGKDFILYLTELVLYIFIFIEAIKVINNKQFNVKRLKVLPPLILLLEVIFGLFELLMPFLGSTAASSSLYFAEKEIGMIILVILIFNCLNKSILAREYPKEEIGTTFTGLSFAYECKGLDFNLIKKRNEVIVEDIVNTDNVVEEVKEIPVVEKDNKIIEPILENKEEKVVNDIHPTNPVINEKFDLKKELIKIKELHDLELIDDEEYKLLKERLLNKK
ncbi:MAG: hypothetical protein PUA56_04105 [Bacillales bacterium]|nr:hypothetical protein [Bacillales bacterium]